MSQIRQIVLDTETTGLETAQGHRIIEIGCVELVNRRVTDNTYHQYLNPDREIDEGATEVHGIRNEDLADKPRFADIADELLAYFGDAELVIHNAEFDVGFLNYELSMLDPPRPRVETNCAIVDSLKLARYQHPGQRNNLDALCRRYGIDNSQRSFHGALLDAELLAEVYLAMTGGQASLLLDASENVTGRQTSHTPRVLNADRPRLPVTTPSASERAAHEQWLDLLDQKAESGALWRRLGAASGGERQG